MNDEVLKDAYFKEMKEMYGLVPKRDINIWKVQELMDEITGDYNERKQLPRWADAVTPE